MQFSISNPASLVFALLFIPTTHAQLLNTLPRCIRDCINQSQYSNCQITDLACVCRASTGNFLPDLVNCMHGNCIDINANVLLGPLQFACELAGAPIPKSAIKNAENQGSSLASQVTKTVTMDAQTQQSTAIVTTTAGGSTYTLVYPVTVEKTTTISGEPSTITATTTKEGFTALIPVVITTTDNEGSTYTTITSQSGTISTYTTTDSEGSTATEKSTYTQTPSSSSSTSKTESADSSSTSTLATSTTVAGQAVTSTSPAESSATSQAPGASPTGQSDSSPFTNTNGATRINSLGSLLGLGGFLVLACVWL